MLRRCGPYSVPAAALRAAIGDRAVPFGDGRRVAAMPCARSHARFASMGSPSTWPPGAHLRSARKGLATRPGPLVEPSHPTQPADRPQITAKKILTAVITYCLIDNIP